MDHPSRVLSVDLLRGADVWLMLFVNEMAGVRGTPAFLLHKPPSADGMTITDVVFPAFLFITGMAIPLALGGRLRRGEAPSSVWRHVLVRTGTLRAIGVLMVNAEHAVPHGILPGPLWNALMTVAVVLVWGTAGEPGRARQRWAWRAAGLALLVALALVYRADGVSGIVQLRPYWWGILGLIGWAYLVAAALYLLAGDRPAVLVGAVALLYLLCLVDEVGAIGALMAVRAFVSVGRVLGSHGALVVSGAVLTLMLMSHRRAERPARDFMVPALGRAHGRGLDGALRDGRRGRVASLAAQPHHGRRERADDLPPGAVPAVPVRACGHAVGNEPVRGARRLARSRYVAIGPLRVGGRALVRLDARARLAPATVREEA